MENFINESKQWLGDMLFLAKMKLRLKMACKMADYKHYIQNRKYYVVPTLSGGLMVVDRDQVKVQKKNGLISKNSGALELQDKAFYYTPTERNGVAASKEDRIRMAKKYRAYVRVLRRVKPSIGTPVKKKRHN